MRKSAPSKLLVFPHSHFCEKARWALDHKGLTYQAVAVMPGMHANRIRKIAPGTSVPVLLHSGTVIQGADRIISYLDETYPGNPLTPDTASDREQGETLERSLDKRFGENLRRILYDRLLNYPSFIRSCFTHTMPWHARIVFPWLFPKLRDRIHTGYVESPAAVELAKKDFDNAMAEVAERLSSREFLVGGRFSRVDLSVAAMLSLIVLPDEHPFPWREIPDWEISAFRDRYADHAVYAWAKDIYRRFRYAGSKMP